MKKTLAEMSLEELWYLFPIFLTKHQEDWKTWYLEEKRALEKVFPQDVRIHHIGSTSVASLWAKPIIDILVEIPKNRDIAIAKEILPAMEYICMSETKERISFNKGYTENGFAQKVFHLHVRYMGDNDELYFRDYLMEHPDVADAYQKLKLKLWKTFEYNRDGYTDAKTEFVTKYTEKAKIRYGNKFK